MVWRRLKTFTRLLLLTAVALFLLVREGPSHATNSDKITYATRHVAFNFISWEVHAFATKAEAALANAHTFLPEAQRKQMVLHYLTLLAQAQQIDGQITRFYIDPAQTDPDRASADLQAELATLRLTLAQQQPTVEAILQEQVAIILAEEGFALSGQAWPPVMMHMTAMPNLLVISPRDTIQRIDQRTLLPGLTTPDKEQIETAVSHQTNLSSLIVPLGGIGTFPAMIQESTNINWLAEVTAHEWAHHWMTFHPVGLYYNTPEVRIINETIASMLDVEIGEQVIARFYPEFVPPPHQPAPSLPEPDPDAPPPFDFNAEMALTRIRADELLAEGKIEAAEAYMEERRQWFVANGYGLRKLNQAYFAFYGAYASSPGATGSDPTGPMLQDIRAASPTLRHFMETVAPINSFAKLEEIWRQTSQRP